MKVLILEFIVSDKSRLNQGFQEQNIVGDIRRTSGMEMKAKAQSSNGMKVSKRLRESRPGVLKFFVL